MLARESRVQPPALDSYSDMPLFNTKAVVRQTGVPAPTLRAWERRYGILMPQRGQNDYRLYSERDMATISWLRERVDSGLTISQAIALLRSLDLGRKRHRRHALGRAPGGFGQPSIAPGGAPILAPSHLTFDELGETLMRQFAALDEAGARRTITQALSIYSIEEACLALFEPVMVRIGNLWRGGDAPVTLEHFASAIVRGQLETLFHLAPASESGPLVIVGCAPGEFHELGALMVALFLRRGGLRVLYLGQSVEPESLLAAVRTARPACVLLSAAQPSQAATLAEVGRRLNEMGPGRPAFFFGGQAFIEQPALVELTPGSYVTAAGAVDEIRHRLAA